MTSHRDSEPPIDFERLRASNPQSGNCGNLGDVLKHAALLELASLAARQGRVDAVDAFGFLLEHPWVDKNKWNSEVQELQACRPAYDRYRSLEVPRDLYRCSAGLLLDTLGDRLGRLFLAEKHDLTRTFLKAQVEASPAAERISVGDDAYRLSTCAACSEKANAFVGLIDPFVLDEAMVEETRRLVALWRHIPTGFVAMFTFERDEPPAFAWPSLGSGFERPFATIARGPYRLAAYGWGEAVGAAGTGLEALGWTPQDSCA